MANINCKLDFKEQAALLALICAALKGELNELHETVDWQIVFDWSCAEGVAAIAFDGVQEYHKHGKIYLPTELKLQWYAASIQCENAYKRQISAIKKLQAFLDNHQIKMMVLKGWGLSLLYPKPAHRYSCDLDIYLFGDERKADKLLKDELGIKIDTSEHHHTVFRIDGVMVENHYDFINVYFEKSAAWLESEFKRLVAETEPLYENGIYLPSSTLNALFLLRHNAQHFAGEKLLLKQLLDWTLFCEKYGDDVDWKLVRACSERVGMLSFLDGIQECSKALFSLDYEFNSVTAKRIWNDIWSPTIGVEPKGFRKYPFKFRRWWHGRWKRKMVFKGNLVSQFLVLFRSHLIKPAI